MTTNQQSPDSVGKSGCPKCGGIHYGSSVCPYSGKGQCKHCGLEIPEDAERKFNNIGESFHKDCPVTDWKQIDQSPAGISEREAILCPNPHCGYRAELDRLRATPQPDIHQSALVREVEAELKELRQWHDWAQGQLLADEETITRLEAHGEAMVAAFREQVLKEIAGFRMTGPSPIGPLHGALTELLARERLRTLCSIRDFLCFMCKAGEPIYKEWWVEGQHMRGEYIEKEPDGTEGYTHVHVHHCHVHNGVRGACCDASRILLLIEAAAGEEK